MGEDRFRTRTEMADYFRRLSLGFEQDGNRSKDPFEKQYLWGKAAAYEIAAFELDHNMEG